MKLTKEKCEKALDTLKEECENCYGVEYMGEQEWFYSCIEKLSKLIEEHFDNQPLNTVDFEHFRLHSDSTLLSLKKDELISYIHMVYHNRDVTDESYYNVMKYAEKLQRELDEKKETPMNKTAKEMFEALGFIRSETLNSIIYTHKSALKIKFGLFDYGYTFGLPRELIEKNEEEFSLVVGLKIHEAIHQQLKELGVVK